MRGIILISHGMYAEALRNSVKMIAGDVANVYSVCLLPDEGMEQFKDKLTELDDAIKDYDEVIVFADLMGGTPSNVATSYYLAEERVSIIAGMNFPQILAAILGDEAVENLVQVGQEGIVNVKAKLQSMALNDDE